VQIAAFRHAMQKLSGPPAFRTLSRFPDPNSNLAQGGFGGVLDPEDRFENHIADTDATGLPVR
jgi:aspartate oxidase